MRNPGYRRRGSSRPGQGSTARATFIGVRVPTLRKLARECRALQRRIAIVATQHFIRLDQFDDTLTISRLLLTDKEDLIHKATGWMLREVGDRSEAALEAFLNEHAGVMPRTMLRYAIEHFPKE